MRSCQRRQSRRRVPNSFLRQSRMEMLELRCMMCGPTVTNVNVSSTAWTSSFVDYLETSNLGTDGYSIPVGSSAQLTTLPWVNINQIRITFSEDVDVQMGDLSLSGANTTARAFSGFSYDSNTYTATWTLSQAITKDKMLLDLDGNGIDPVCNANQEVLDGEWTTSSSTYPSGNGIAGGDFEFRFNAVPGDSNANGTVTIVDVATANSLSGKQAGDTGYNIRYDVDGNGQIAVTDCMAIYGRLGQTLPTANPAGMSNDAPTTAGFAAVDVNQNAADEVLSLFDAFEDAEDGDDLTFSVVSNSNPDLFVSVAIDDMFGELSLDFAYDKTGDALLTIRATDGGGLFVDTILAVSVASTNQAPVISNFLVWNDMDMWTFDGVVTDVDDNVAGMVVTFGGVLASYNLTAIVQADGSFFVCERLDGLTSGIATAQTQDDQGALSNVATTYVFMS